jgi:tRNA A37 methylthiotransferase MiaB
MKVVLASVSFTTPYTAQLRMLSLGYIHAQAVSDDFVQSRATILHNHYDCAVSSAEQTAADLLSEQPDLLAFSCYVWNTPDVLRVCTEIHKQRPELPIILGGPEVSYHYAKILDQNASVRWICVNEGEETFRELLVALLQGADTTEIQNLAQRKDDEQGTPFVPSLRPFCKDLDSLASPYLTGVLEVCEIRHGACYQTARGCPFVCSYCDYGRNQPYYEFSLERVKAEMEFFAAHGATLLFNTDPTFNYNRKRAEAILQILLDTKLEATHWYEVFPSLVNDGLVELASQSYSTFMGVGIQSSNPDTMRNIKRVWKPDKIAPILDKLTGLPNIMLSCEIIMGLPGDGLSDYLDTVTYAYERDPADIKSFNLAILPRTPLEKEVDKWGITFDPDVGHEIISTDFMTAHEVIVGKAVNDWHRLLQRLVHMLVRVIHRPGGKILEEWAHRAHDEGFHDRIPDLRTHNIDAELVEGLAAVWERYVSEQCGYAGVPDVSAALKAEFQYQLFRRARTWAAAYFGDVRDIYFNMPFEGLHRFFDATPAARPAADDVTGKETPRLMSDVSLATLAYDMDDLYMVTDTEGLAAVSPKQTEYAFFTTPDTGAGCGIIVDAGARSFLELVNGTLSVDAIGVALGQQLGDDVGREARRIYAALQATGIFSPPRFLKDPREGKIAWQSSFPEVHREYH